jgi:hypothetical protein
MEGEARAQRLQAEFLEALPFMKDTMLRTSLYMALKEGARL